MKSKMKSKSSWMKLIQWDKFYIKERDLHLYLVSKLIRGDGIEFPDIPPLAVAISFDTLDKINLLKDLHETKGH